MTRDDLLDGAVRQLREASNPGGGERARVLAAVQGLGSKAAAPGAGSPAARGQTSTHNAGEGDVGAGEGDVGAGEGDVGTGEGDVGAGGTVARHAGAGPFARAERALLGRKTLAWGLVLGLTAFGAGVGVGLGVGIDLGRGSIAPPQEPESSRLAVTAGARAAGEPRTADLEARDPRASQATIVGSPLGARRETPFTESPATTPPASPRGEGLPTEPASTAQAAATPASAAPALATPALATPATATRGLEAQTARPRRSPRPRAKPRAQAPATGAAAAKAALSLAEALQRLHRAERAIYSGNAAWALSLLDELDAGAPRGMLREERTATRILALCADGQVESAERLASEARRETPSSIYGSIIERACSNEASAAAAHRSDSPVTNLRDLEH